MEEIAAAAEDSVDLGEYEEDAGDDAVTRIYDGDDLESEGPVQSQAWMHDSRPPDGGKSGWSRWAVVALLGVLVAVASGAAVMASRSMARVPQATPSAEVKVAAAGAEASTRPVVAKAPEPGKLAAGAGAAASGSPVGALAAVSGSANEGEAAESSAVGGVLEESSAERPTRERRTARQRAAARRAAARKAASRSAGSTQPARASEEEEDEEPATVGVLDLPEADEEPEAPVAPPKPKAAPGESDLVIEDGTPKVAFLSVDASPYATVFIDGEKKGVTPLVRLELAPGLHRMVARTEDGRTKRYTLQLDSGKTEVLKLAWEE
jgi:serine/threonine-protein kinase